MRWMNFGQEPWILMTKVVGLTRIQKLSKKMDVTKDLHFLNICEAYAIIYKNIASKYITERD